MDKFTKELGRWRGIVNHEVGHAMFTLWRANKKSKKIEGKKSKKSSKDCAILDAYAPKADIQFSKFYISGPTTK